MTDVENPSGAPKDGRAVRVFVFGVILRNATVIAKGVC
jgi:hypothetical protein